MLGNSRCTRLHFTRDWALHSLPRSDSEQTYIELRKLELIFCARNILLNNMTLPDEYPEDTGALSKRVLQEVSRSLEKLLQDAQLDNRLTTGVYNCAEILQRCPDQVMLCILPDSGPGHDVTIDIEHTLIEAHCWENDVRVLKVGNAHVLNKVLNNDVSLREMKKASRQQPQGVDASCLLVKYPKEVKEEGEWLDIERFCNWCLKHDVVQYVDIHSPD